MAIQEQIQWRKHRNCPVHVERGNWGPHHSRLMCSKHGKMICWLNRQSADLVEQHLTAQEQSQ